MARSSTTFKAGQSSANPGGRPREVAEIRELARTYTFEALETLVSIMRDENAKESARIASCNAVLDRGYGRPIQELNIAQVERPINEWSTSQLYAYLQQTQDHIENDVLLIDDAHIAKAYSEILSSK